MSTLLVLEQTLNGIQFGVFLFLISAGLTLVLGIMNVVNLAHGALFMMGAFFASTFVQWTGSFLLAFLLLIPASVLLGIIIELVVLRPLYLRDHMDQVLATFGLILFFNEGVKLVWGVEARPMDIPPLFTGNVEIFPDAPYPIFRIFIIALGLIVAASLF
ncbi:MAG: branched-chain amino acid ABC transporter permease, partial [Proteobacteria bacterium]|nr:branched-chain amino acid ABC transporter permease [Pseudomonadota bacterium]